MKRYPIILFLLLYSVIAKAQRDSSAIFILRKMNMAMMQLKSCTFNATSYIDVWNEAFGNIQHQIKEQVSFRFPNSFRINVTGDYGHKSLFSNGKIFTLYSHDTNSYATTLSADNITWTIDTLSKTYGIEFPGADFFYPTFADELTDTSVTLIYLGITDINGRQCYHLAGYDTHKYFQFWIEQNDILLPAKMLLCYPEEPGYPRFEVVYDQWHINTVFPDAVFDFEAPPGASKIKLMKRSN